MTAAISSTSTSRTAIWMAWQIIEAVPEETAPRYLLRDRDAIYGEAFTRCAASMGIRAVIIAARAPWQNAFVECHRSLTRVTRATIKCLGLAGPARRT
jgi:hypothetical protein